MPGAFSHSIAGHASNFRPEEQMSRRFVTLLERIAEIRHLIEREESSAAPRSVRLMRLKKLQLQLSESLREISAKQLIAMASAPSFKPKLVFRDVQSASAMSRGW
jgi:uncharacterized protein YdcH (DUF465 family)